MENQQSEQTFFQNEAFGEVTDKRVIFRRKWFCGVSRVDIPLKHVTSVRLDTNRSLLLIATPIVVAVACFYVRSEFAISVGVFALMLDALLLWGSPTIVVNTSGRDTREAPRSTLVSATGQRFYRGDPPATGAQVTRLTARWSRFARPLVSVWRVPPRSRLLDRVRARRVSPGRRKGGEARAAWLSVVDKRPIARAPAARRRGRGVHRTPAILIRSAGGEPGPARGFTSSRSVASSRPP